MEHWPGVVKHSWGLKSVHWISGPYGQKPFFNSIGALRNKGTVYLLRLKAPHSTV
jgi:hypothetical protein